MIEQIFTSILVVFEKFPPAFNSHFDLTIIVINENKLKIAA